MARHIYGCRNDVAIPIDPDIYLVGNKNYKKQKSDFTNCLFYNRCAYPLASSRYQKMIFPYAETSLWYLIDRSGLSYLIYGIFGPSSEYQGGIFTFLKKTRVVLFLLFSFYFLAGSPREFI